MVMVSGLDTRFHCNPEIVAGHLFLETFSNRDVDIGPEMATLLEIGHSIVKCSTRNQVHILMVQIVLIFILALSACSLVPDDSSIVDTNETTQGQQIRYYSDEDINELVQQFPFLTAGEYSTPSPESALEQLGINLDTLVQVERRVGDCFDQFVYDLSPSYLLVIDRNACFGLRIWVETKDSSD